MMQRIVLAFCPDHLLLCNAPKQEYGAILTAQHTKSSLAALTLAAVGIVYGDIGTSPLYTLKAVFDKDHGLALTTPQPDRHHFPDFLGADPDRLAQVRHPDAARRQPRRGRHHGAHGAGAQFGHQGVQMVCAADGDGRLRRHHVLRRQRDHPRHFGARRDRRSRGRPSRHPHLGGAAHYRHCAGVPVFGAAARHGRYRGAGSGRSW